MVLAYVRKKYFTERFIIIPSAHTQKKKKVFMLFSAALKSSSLATVRVEKHGDRYKKGKSLERLH